MYVSSICILASFLFLAGLSRAGWAAGAGHLLCTDYSILLAWEVYICVLVLLHANRSGHKFYKSVSEPLKK